MSEFLPKKKHKLQIHTSNANDQQTLYIKKKSKNLKIPNIEGRRSRRRNEVHRKISQLNRTFLSV